jgi:hypothetical protein
MVCEMVEYNSKDRLKENSSRDGNQRGSYDYNGNFRIYSASLLTRRQKCRGSAGRADRVALSFGGSVAGSTFRLASPPVAPSPFP